VQSNRTVDLVEKCDHGKIPLLEEGFDLLVVASSLSVDVLLLRGLPFQIDESPVKQGTARLHTAILVW
jgi:hypothetical protein